MNRNEMTSSLKGLGNEQSRFKTDGAQARALLFWASLLTLGCCFIPNPYYDIILWPIRLFVTMIHESGHAIATLISGGSVKYIQIHANGEGVTWSTRGIAPWLVISGGYLGTTLFGALLLQLVRRSGHKVTLMFIGGYIALVTLLWANNPFDNTFTFVTGAALSVLFFFAARKLTDKAAAFLVSFLAVQCCLNAIGDLRILLYLTTAAPGADNDAVFMSQSYSMFPPTFWAGVWAIMAVGILSLSLWRYLRATGGPRAKLNPAARAN